MKISRENLPIINWSGLRTSPKRLLAKRRRWYEHIDPAYDLDSYAWYQDGTEGGSTIIGSANNSQDLDVDTIYFLRIVMQETAGGAANNVTAQLQYELNDSASWNDVNASSTGFQSVASGNIADGGDTTQRVGAGSFITPNDGIDEVDGLAGGANLDFVGSDEAELLFAVQIISGDVSDADKFDFRLTVGGTPIPITNQPTCTVNEPGGTTFFETTAGTQNSSGVLAGKALKAAAGSQATSGDVAKQTQPAALTGSQGSSGDVFKQTQPAPLTGSQGSSGELTAVKTAFQTNAGTQNSSGDLTGKALKPLAGSQGSSGDVTKQAQPAALTASQATSGVLTAIKIALKSIAGSQGSSGVLTALAQKVLGASQATSGALSVLAQKVNAGTQNSSGVLTAIKLAFKTNAGSQGSSGTLTKQANKPLAAVQGSSGLIAIQTIKPAGGTQGSSGALATLYIPAGGGGDEFEQAVAGSQGSSGTVAKFVGKPLGGIQASGGDLVKLTSISASGAQASSGALTTALIVKPGYVSASFALTDKVVATLALTDKVSASLALTDKVSATMEQND